MAGKKILFIQTAFLGDVLLSFPLLRLIRENNPGCELTVITRSGVGSLVKDFAFADRFYEIKKGQWSTYKKIIDLLSAETFDHVFCPHQSFTTARFLFQIRAKNKIGFELWWNQIFFNERIKKDLSLPEPLRLVSLLKNHVPDLQKKLNEFQQAEVSWAAKNTIHLSPIPEWAVGKVGSGNFSNVDLNQLSLPKKYICLFPGSVWATKQWTTEGFIDLAQRLKAEGENVVLMGGPGEEELGAKIFNAVPGCLNLVAKTSLKETVAILSKAKLVFSNDSAGQHLAALVQAPTISIFGPTVPKFGYRPWNSEAVIVERVGLTCRPCGAHGHRQCPIGTHECMKSISATEVLAARNYLNQ